MQATNGGSMRRGFMGGVMVLLTSCGAAAQVAMAPPAQDAAGKQFNPTARGHGGHLFLQSVKPSSIIVAPGDMRFVEVEMPPGAPVCTIQEAGTDAGRSGVLAGNRALQPQ
jgi:hypothetical protein